MLTLSLKLNIRKQGGCTNNLEFSSAAKIGEHTP